ncbi:MAG: circularly permuted type 2 ATP-grasp protein [Ilumatobacteraceae bacterium]|nr:circularly permuted type 2 ATP-grasp protein [Ilumatobacteraceae bacterium]
MSMAELRTAADLWDELLEPDGSPRAASNELVQQLKGLGLAELQQRQDLAELDIVGMGITFTVYSDGRGIDRAWPFDVVPRIIGAEEWRVIERGLAQRLRAINMFIDDVYHEQCVIRDGVFPAELLAHSVNFRQECVGANPKFGVWAHISGSDLVRDGDGTMYVLEDNLRVPSGVSYMLENRAISKRAFADLFAKQSILPVDAYTDELNRMLTSIAPDGITEPTIAVLTPGIYNSAYFEHSFLAQRIGAALVEGIDLVVGDDDCVYMRTIDGLERVHVIYRRVDDLFIDPEVFRKDSTLGVPGLMRSWRAGNVAIANAPGAGVADDKVVYAWVPDFVHYYLQEEPLLPNVPTYRCVYDDERRYVIEHIDELVIKPANESGGYGLLIGNRASRTELDEAIARIEADPRNWVAQPTLALSTVPTLCDGVLEPRHVDLRPFILSGATSYVSAGGLTRVALRKGSLIVNSSQGGGSKDTWIGEA